MYAYLILVLVLLAIFQLAPIQVNTRYIITGAMILFAITGEVIIAIALTINGCRIYVKMNPEKGKFLKLKVNSLNNNLMMCSFCIL